MIGDVKVNANEALKGSTITVKVTGVRVARLRVLVCKVLLRLARMVWPGEMRMEIEVVQ